MAGPKTVAEARKEMQTKRLKEKGKKGYPEFYAKQPLQVEKAARNEKYRAAKASVKKAAEVLAIAEITGEGLEEAKHDHAVATLLVERAVPPGRGAIATLSGA